MESTPNEYRSSIGTSIGGSLKDNPQQLSQNENEWVQRYHTAQAKAREAVGASEDFVKAHPFYTVLGAATVGFVAGMLIRKNQ